MKKDRRKKDGQMKPVGLFIPMVIIFCLMACMVIYTTNVIRDVAVTNIHEIGEDKIAGTAAQLENYLEMTKSVLWVTADTVDHMVQNGASTDEILQYITEESENQEQHFDENYTGIYGYVSGEYLDGVGWTPPEGYVPTERDWYTAAIEANGESTIVSPYVDAQTHAVIISISRMLSNGKDVLSLDVMMNHIQDIVADLRVQGKGYGFIVNDDGMIIAHHNKLQKGRYLNVRKDQKDFMKKVHEIQNGSFETTLYGKKSTVFVHQIMDQWNVIIVVSNRELYAEVWRQLIVNILISTIIFALIMLFYVFGRRNERNYSRRIDEMRAEEQRQAFEAKSLKLEKDAADQANRAKSDFLADMSHEIRTPINAVLGMNEMILRESMQARDSREQFRPEEQAYFNNIISYADNIQSAGGNLLSIINDLLDFSKIESGIIDIVDGNYQLSHVLSDVRNMMTYRAEEKGLELVTDIDQNLPNYLYGDEVRVRQIITNILNNAVKYTDEGSVRMSVTREENAALEDGNIICLKFVISDTGIGIKPEDIDKLFTKFQRVDLDRNSTVEGTGLGLAITKSLLELMGGDIQVQSEYGKGSTFTITLPQKVVSSEPIADAGSQLKDSRLEDRSYRESFYAPDAHIMVVDDTRMNLTVVVGLLKNTAVKIDTASSGTDSVEMARVNPYDLILMDQRMPGMDGTEALHRIREQKDGLNRKTPIICLTADAVIGAKERYLAEGFTDYITKPIESAALERMLIRYLPEDKVVITEKKEPQSPADNKYMTTEFDKLRVVDWKTGLQFCQNDEELYKSLLQEFAVSGPEKLQDIVGAFEVQDWILYGTLVHALKSTSKVIGAGRLSEMAAHLENAAKASDTGTILTEHADMIEQYNAVIDDLKQYYPEAMLIEVEDDDILEFMPEEGESDD